MNPATEHVVTSAQPAGAELGINLTNVAYKADATLLTKALDNVVRLGLKHVRHDCAWKYMETSKGSYSWGAWDQLLTECEKRGLTALPTVHESPAWSTGNASIDTQGLTKPNHVTDYADFCRAFVTRYKGRIDAIEVWNEPNLDQFWTPNPDPIMWVAAIRAARDAVKAIDPDLLVVSGGLGGDGPAPDVSPEDYLPAAYAAGLAEVCDVIAFHPYSNGDAQVSGGLYQMGPLRRIMDDHHDQGRPVWATETGNPTGGTAGQQFTDGATQARILRVTVEYLRGHIGRMGRIYIYQLDDDAAKQPDREGYFGIIDKNGADKPAVAEVQRLAADTTGEGFAPVARFVLDAGRFVPAAVSA